MSPLKFSVKSISFCIAMGVMFLPSLRNLHGEAIAEFSGGLGDSQPNQFHGTGGAGWASGWIVSFTGGQEESFTFDIKKDPAFSGEPDVLQISRIGNDGFARVERLIDTATTDLSAPVEIRFQIRADEFSGTAEQPFLFSIGAYSESEAKGRSIQAATWTLVVSEKTSAWGIYHVENGTLLNLNTKVPLQIGTVYSITIKQLPAEDRFAVLIEWDGNTYESPLLSSGRFGSRSELLFFGGWVPKNVEGNFKWSLGPVKVSSSQN